MTTGQSVSSHSETTTGAETLSTGSWHYRRTDQPQQAPLHSLSTLLFPPEELESGQEEKLQHRLSDLGVSTEQDLEISPGRAGVVQDRAELGGGEAGQAVSEEGEKGQGGAGLVHTTGQEVREQGQVDQVVSGVTGKRGGQTMEMLSTQH